ncbi:MAG: flagellar motor protein MotB [Chloroherpetonaceae bacterium]|jgi:chemotaxis protein MotB
MPQQDEKHSKEQPIIIKKVKKYKHAGAHGGAWKVAYADFVTAMMALFIVLWVLASSEEVKKNVEAYFDNPGAFNLVTGKPIGGADINIKVVPQKGEGGEKEKKPLIIQFDQKTTDTLSKIIMEKAKEDSARAANQVIHTGDSLKKYFQDMQVQNPKLKELLESLKIEITSEGLRIELLENKESLYFKVGSAQLTPPAVEILKVLSKEIGKLPNNVVIEGHTDSRKYTGKTVYSNWELSADRANSARRVLSQTGLWDGQISQVVGYADTKLRNPQNPFDLTNRRVSILIKQFGLNQFLPKINDSAAISQ